MPARSRLTLLALTALLVTAGGTLAACGSGGSNDAAAGNDGDGDSSVAQANVACNTAQISAVAKQQLPANVPSPAAGAKAYQYLAQGATKYFFFALPGDPDALPTLRDDYDKSLTGKGYTITDTDEEEGSEAESEFSGPHDGSTNWRNLCKGKVVLRIGLDS